MVKTPQPNVNAISSQKTSGHRRAWTAHRTAHQVSGAALFDCLYSVSFIRCREFFAFIWQQYIDWRSVDTYIYPMYDSLSMSSFVSLVYSPWVLHCLQIATVHFPKCGEWSCFVQSLLSDTILSLETVTWPVSTRNSRLFRSHCITRTSTWWDTPFQMNRVILPNTLFDSVFNNQTYNTKPVTQATSECATWLDSSDFTSGARTPFEAASEFQITRSWVQLAKDRLKLNHDTNCTTTYLYKSTMA